VIAVPRGAEGQSGPVRFAVAGHPVPDIFSLAAAREILSVMERAGKGDLVVALVSGGGSAMLSAPAAGITMEEKAETFRFLLRAGADIASFNAVRKHLSEVKGVFSPGRRSPRPHGRCSCRTSPATIRP